jgi:hypothetical protein
MGDEGLHRGEYVVSGVCDRRSQTRSGEHREAANGRFCALDGAHKLDADVLSEESGRFG